jgi:myo-inositol-1(or 4)-monophosphatase
MDHKFTQTLCRQVCDLSKEVGAFIRTEVTKLKRSDIELKGHHDLVTYVDKSVEKRIVEVLSKILPEAGFIVEENTTTKKGEKYNWVVDPLDGTTNFVHAIPVFSVSIALMEDDEVILGVVYEVNNDECFYSWKGGEAFLNDSEISVSQNKLLDDALVATGFPYNDFERLDIYIEFFKMLLVKSRGMRRLGSAAVDLAYVACGRFDVFFEYSLNPWDVAAGAFIVKQAGGEVFDFKGGDDYIFGKEIVASNPLLAVEFLSQCKKYFIA